MPWGVVAGVVDPLCIRPGDDPLSPATRALGRLAVLVHRLWSSERARRGGRLYLLSTLPDEGRPWAERPRALAFYGRTMAERAMAQRGSRTSAHGQPYRAGRGGCVRRLPLALQRHPPLP